MKSFLLATLVSTSLLIACNNEKKPAEDVKEEQIEDSAEAKEEKNKQTALASINALIAGNVDSVLKDVAPDAIDYNDGSMAAIKGRDSIQVMMKSWRESLSDYKADDLLALADGDYVIVSGVFSATFKGDVMGMKTAGKKVKIKDVDIFKFNSEGKITEHHNVQSSAEMIRQLTAK